jgi:hypothetical protein
MPPPIAPVRESARAEQAEPRPLIDLSGQSNGKLLPGILELLNSRRAELESVLPSYLAERRHFPPVASPALTIPHSFCARWKRLAQSLLRTARSDGCCPWRSSGLAMALGH